MVMSNDDVTAAGICLSTIVFGNHNMLHLENKIKVSLQLFCQTFHLHQLIAASCDLYIALSHIVISTIFQLIVSQTMSMNYQAYI